MYAHAHIRVDVFIGRNISVVFCVDYRWDWVFLVLQQEMYTRPDSICPDTVLL